MSAADRIGRWLGRICVWSPRLRRVVRRLAEKIAAG